MKIGIDVRMFGPFHSGLGRTNQQHILALQKLDTDHEFVLFLNDDAYDTVPDHPKFKKVRANIGWYGWEEQTKLKKIISREEVDLMHFPHWNVPLAYSEPFIVTIHDLIMQHYKRPDATTLGPFTYWIKDKVARIVLNHAAKKAQHIMTPSEFTKMDVSKMLRIDPNKITTIYEGVTKHEDSSKDDSVLKTFNITKPYVLYVGNAYPHKNLDTLVDAWYNMPLNDEYELVLVGKHNHFYKQLVEHVKNKGIKNIVFTDFVEDSDLGALYKYATLYVFPSLYEGFGLPPLEAMAHGVPVVSSDSSCLPEILGSGALFFDATSVDHMADTIERALSDESVRFDLVSQGREEIKRYSWEEYAKKTLHIYNQFLK